MRHLPQVEKLLAEISGDGWPANGQQRRQNGRPGGAKTGAGGGLDARVRMFERLASEVARLHFYAARGKVPFLPLAPHCLHLPRLHDNFFWQPSGE